MSDPLNLPRSLYLLTIIAVAVWGWFTYRAFSNPDMTRTRLLFTFWPEYLLGIGLVMIAYLVTRHDR